MLPNLHEGEDRLRVDRHLRLRPVDPVAGEELVVVGDDPVVHADDSPVPDRMVVRLDVRMTLREVPNVDEGLARLRRHRELVEQRARAAAELRHLRGRALAAMCVSDGVGTALGDAREQGLRGQRPVDGRVRIEAESGDAAHELLFDSVDRTTRRT